MKYLGSKSKIAKDILPIILEEQKNYSVYVEPFCGGLSTIEKVTGIERLACDKNPYLIAMWKGLQMGLDKPMEIPKTLYDECRNDYNGRKSVIESVCNIVNNPEDYPKTFEEIFLIGWVGFMGSFNGRFFDGGYSGKTDTRDYVDEQIRNTLKQVPLLKSEIFPFEFRCFDYTTLFEKISKYAGFSFFKRFYQNSLLIYCDPPYRNTKQYAFSTNFDYEDFYQGCRLLNKLGHKIFVSEYEMPSDFKCVWEMEVTNSMHPTKTKKPIERLFTL